MLFIDAIAIVESAGKNVPGDHGAAISVFQIHKESWEDVRNRFGDPAGPIHLDVGDTFSDIGGDDSASRMRARNCATGYMFILEARLKREGIAQTPENIYACWNLGFEGFKRLHFALARCPKATFHNAKRVAQLVKQVHPASTLLHGHD